MTRRKRARVVRAANMVRRYYRGAPLYTLSVREALDAASAIRTGRDPAEALNWLGWWEPATHSVVVFGAW